MNSASLERAVAFVCALDDACAERSVACAGGHAILDSRHPRLWSANHLRIQDGAVADVDAVVDAAERHFGSLEFRMITVSSERLGGELHEPLARYGYEPCHDLLMILDRGLPNLDEPARIEEVSLDEIAASRITAAIERFDRGIGEQLVSRDKLIAAAVWVQSYAVFRDGELAARCQLYTDGLTAQVENVYTHPGYRRRGFARALVTHATRIAQAGGASVVFLLADAADWPQELYRQVGFGTTALLPRFRRS